MYKSMVSGLILLCSTGILAEDLNFGTADALPGIVSGPRENEPCPPGTITGQIPSFCTAQNTAWYFYSDLNYYSGTQSARVRCEDFPKTGLLDPNDPNQRIETITWYGVNIGADYCPCLKGPPGTYQFRIRFYNDTDGAPDPNYVYEELVTPSMVHIEDVFSGCLEYAPRWQYTAALTTPVQMTHGWFSICGMGSPTCWSLWQGSGDDGDNRFYGWWEVNGTIPGPPDTDRCDLSYCFGLRTTGACCDDCSGSCTEDVPAEVCAALGGRFHRDAPCSSFGDPNYPGDPNSPNVACGQALGACCHNDGTCERTTCGDCRVHEPQPCRADANCDGVRDFADIDPFVAVLSGAPPCRFENLDVNGDGVINFDDIDPFVAHLGLRCPVGPICRGDADCDGDVDFDDLDDLENIIYHGAVPCSFENVDCDANGVIDPNDYYCFLEHMGEPGCSEPGSRGNRWLGPDVSCDQCCKVDCNDPNYGVTHPENEPCGQDLNGGCNRHLDPNDPNSPVDPNGWEHLGVIIPDQPTVVCGTLWADAGQRDTDWYDFSLSVRGTLSWIADSDLPIITTPIFADGNLSPPTIPVNCPPGAPLWGYFNLPSDLPCFHDEQAPNDIFPRGVSYWWVVFPDSGGAIFYGYPCEEGWNNYRISILLTALVCDPCEPTDIPETEPGCGPGYVDTFNAGCDAVSGFPVPTRLDPNTWYCGQTGTWLDPNGDFVVDYDWWKIVLTGTVNKRLQFRVQSAFNLRYELYSVPSDNCANRVRLDYYEFGACESNVTITTECLAANGAVYYLRIVPTSVADCAQYNTYRFLYSIVSEAPACTLCNVTCSTNIDDACQTDPYGPESNAGCNAADPNDPDNYMSFPVGNNTFGAKVCGRLSTFTGNDGTPRADFDWFRFTQPPDRTKLVIRAKAKFRMSINIRHGCDDPNSITHGWDRPCKGTTTAATQTYQPLTPNTQYFGEILYGNGGGDASGEQPLKQFFLGLPCTDNRNNYEVELQAQT